MTTLHAGGKFNSKVYETSGGLHGVGVSVANALSESMEVEVARGQKLYRQSYTRGKPDGPLKSLGAVKNRRGTKVRFRPDPKIFGKGAAFRPARLFRMARSKAYLFRGVEIRWSCAKALLQGDSETPESAVFHFPGGLKDFLASRIEGQETRHQRRVHRKDREDRRLRLGRMGDRLDRQRRRVLEFLLQHRAHARRGDARGGLARRAHQEPARLWRTHRQQARRPSDGRRRARHRRRHALHVHPRAGVPGPDQGQAREPGGRPHRRGRAARRLRPLADRKPGPGQPPARLGHRPRRGTAPPQEGKGDRPADGDADACASPASSPTAR